MMKSLLIALFLCSSASITNNSTTVYISTGNKAVAYHAKMTCRTLKRCLDEGHVKAITLDEALQMGRRPCKVCH